MTLNNTIVKLLLHRQGASGLIKTTTTNLFFFIYARFALSFRRGYVNMYQVTWSAVYKYRDLITHC